VKDILSRTELCAHINQGRPAKYLFFWGHRPTRDGSVGKTCFSQWFESAFEVAGIRYPTAEHYMMTEKARLFGDTDTLTRIIAAPNPGAAKALGREIRNFEEKRWVEQRFSIVVNGNLAKFSQNEALAAFLLGTGERILVEASPLDTIWGIGLAADDPLAADPNTWNGLNLLGFALMEVRRLLGARHGAPRTSKPTGARPAP
jgi:ribA/ribD-fused uncharacterized protein